MEGDYVLGDIVLVYLNFYLQIKVLIILSALVIVNEELEPKVINKRSWFLSWGGYVLLCYVVILRSYDLGEKVDPLIACLEYWANPSL